MANKIKTNVAYGRYPALINLANDPIIAQRAPNQVHDLYEVGQEWINELTNNVYVLTSYVAGLPIWTLLGAGAVPGGFVFVPNNTAIVALNPNTINYLTAAAAVTATLPAIAAVGSQIWIIDSNAAVDGNGIIIAQRAGQTMYYAGVQTVVGVGHGLTAIHDRQILLAIELICTVANTTWAAVSTNAAFINY